MRWFGWLRGRQGVETGLIEAMALQEGTPVALMGGRMRTMGLPYALPRDMEEINRLDFQHYMLRYALRGLYAVPLQQPRAILDAGTGTGRWAMEMAQIFPHAQVCGVDVNPPPADEQAARGLDVRPANYTFTPGNVLEELPFDDGQRAGGATLRRRDVRLRPYAAALHGDSRRPLAARHQRAGAGDTPRRLGGIGGDDGAAQRRPARRDDDDMDQPDVGASPGGPDERQPGGRFHARGGAAQRGGVGGECADGRLG